MLSFIIKSLLVLFLVLVISYNFAPAVFNNITVFISSTFGIEEKTIMKSVEKADSVTKDIIKGI